MEEPVTSLIEDKVLIVLGAGASKEFGLPTGKELSERIINLLAIKEDRFNPAFSDYEFNRAVEISIRSQLINGGKQSALDSANLLRRGLVIAPSIDNFLHTHRRDADTVFLGKLAIVTILLRAEAASKLTVDVTNLYNVMDLKKVADTWLGLLFTQLSVAGDFFSFISRLSRINFISFNYDRCVQQFFTHASRQYFDLSETEVATVLANLNLIYIYGSVGPYQIRSKNESSFGGTTSAELLIELAGQIQTFTEGRISQDGTELADIIDCSREVYFLGFGFNKLNVERILGDKAYACGSVFATVKGQPELAAAQIRRDIDQRFGHHVVDGSGQRVNVGSVTPVFKNSTCAELIWDCHRNFQTAPD